MLQKNHWPTFGFVALLLVLVTACGSVAEETAGSQQGNVPESISCEVFYRSLAGGSMEGSTVTLSTNGDRQSLTFDDLGFEAVFLSDAGEGQSLSISITDLHANSELTRALYQIDQQNGLNDQFIGGHGFTGLAYVYHPASDSELQYFCLTGP
jgi:hypothetical protein